MVRSSQPPSNAATGSGGGLWNAGRATATVLDSIGTGNTAVDTTARQGSGGLYTEAA